MFKTYYGFTCNPFDKQNLKERDCFLSHDHKEMLSRLDYLKEIRGLVFLRPDPVWESLMPCAVLPPP